ncbi:hypothetical protein Tco_1563231 [Tanacetum coccineum]
MLPLWTVDPPFSQSSKSSQDDGSKPSSDDVKKLMKIQEKIYINSDDDEDVGAEADMNNLNAFMPVFKNKKDERGIVIKNKAILVAQGYIQEEDIKSAFLYGKTKEEVYVCQPPGFEDPNFPYIVSKRKDRQELGLSVRTKGDILLVQVQVCIEILKKFGFPDVKTASTPMETQKLLLRDEDGDVVDVHLYRSIIGSLMYLTSSRPDIILQYVPVQDTKST